jgi:hypothetical protein
VSKSIGLGRSSRRERSWREVPKHRGSCLGQGPWPVKSWLAASRKRRCHPQFRVAIERSGPWKSAASAGDCWRGSAEFGDSWLCSRTVSIAEVDKRRVALRARERRVRGTDDGSSPPTRERSEGERASEAGSSVAKPRDRWRVPVNRSDCESGTPGSTCRGKALWAGISRSH